MGAPNGLINNPGGRPRGHGIAYYLSRIGDEDLVGPDGIRRTKNELVSRKAFAILLSKDTSNKDFIHLLSEVIDRRDGKAVAFAITHDVDNPNPLADINSEHLQRLRDRLALVAEAIVVPASPVDVPVPPPENGRPANTGL